MQDQDHLLEFNIVFKEPKKQRNIGVLQSSNFYTDVANLFSQCRIMSMMSKCVFRPLDAVGFGGVLFKQKYDKILMNGGHGDILELHPLSISMVGLRLSISLARRQIKSNL